MLFLPPFCIAICRVYKVAKPPPSRCHGNGVAEQQHERHQFRDDSDPHHDLQLKTNTFLKEGEVSNRNHSRDDDIIILPFHQNPEMDLEWASPRRRCHRRPARAKWPNINLATTNVDNNEKRVLWIRYTKISSPEGLHRCIVFGDTR